MAKENNSAASEAATPQEVDHRVLQALEFSKAAYRSRNASFGESALPIMRLQGTPDTWVDISWQETNSVAYLAFKGPLMKEYKTMRGSSMQPKYLRGVSAAARVDAAALWRFEALLEHSGDIAGIRGAVMNLSGGNAPRRVVCTGYCVGGSIAGVAAPWAAMTWPDADVRCITFGSLPVGNRPFAHVFSWLVATKYPVYHAGDPLATSAATDGLLALGHIINISPDHADMAEIKGVKKELPCHDLEAYEESLTHARQGSILQLPSNTSGLQGISRKSLQRHITDLWHANKKRRADATGKKGPGQDQSSSTPGLDNFQGCAERQRGFEDAALAEAASPHAQRPTSLNEQATPVIGWFQGAVAAAAAPIAEEGGGAPHTAAAETAYGVLSGNSGEENKRPAQQQQQQGTAAPSQAPRERASPSMVFQEGAHVAAVDHSNAEFGKMYLASRVRGPALASHGMYHSLDYFKGVTGLRTADMLVCKRTETYCAVGWMPSGTLVIAFRGTSTLKHVAQDIKFFSARVEFLPEAFPRAKAHSGFLEQLSSITNPDQCCQNLEATIKALTGGREPNRIICCGHSLGAAVAALAGMWAALQYPDADIRCYGFGTPKTGNKQLCQAFNFLVGHSIRVENGHDPIPLLPAHALGYDVYEHSVALHRRRIFQDRRPLVCKVFPDIMDHGMVNYVRKLKTCIPSDSGVKVWDDPNLRPEQDLDSMLEKNKISCSC
ncbi:probable mono- and diacylglycerol lipase at C-terminar half [Coccomyxa sp. Obi]|nr:probable mono- and diacylglycerol lipase at C-terminar half [Coccomyxa sp. Obi]